MAFSGTDRPGVAWAINFADYSGERIHERKTPSLPEDFSDARFFAAISITFAMGILWMKVGWVPRVLRARMLRAGTFRQRAEKLWDSSRGYLRDPIALVLSTVAGTAVQLCAVLITVLFSRELGVTISFAVFSLLLAGAAVGGVLEFCRRGETIRATSAWN
jgi:hypothetical protein